MPGQPSPIFPHTNSFIAPFLLPPSPEGVIKKERGPLPSSLPPRKRPTASSLTPTACPWRCTALVWCWCVCTLPPPCVLGGVVATHSNRKDRRKAARLKEHGGARCVALPSVPLVLRPHPSPSHLPSCRPLCYRVPAAVHGLSWPGQVERGGGKEASTS